MQRTEFQSFRGNRKKNRERIKEGHMREEYWH